MKKTVIIAATLASFVCAMAVWSQSRPANMRPGGMREHTFSCPAVVIMPPHADMVSRIAKPLKLTNYQVSKLKKITINSDKKIEALKKSSFIASKALKAAVFTSKYNVKSVKKLAANAQSAEGKIISAEISEWTLIRSILTSNQAKQLQQMVNIPNGGQMGKFAGPRPMNGFGHGFAPKR